MAPEGQIPAEEFAADTLKQIVDGFLAIFRFRQHALDGVGRKLSTRYVNGHGFPPKENASARESILCRSRRSVRSTLCNLKKRVGLASPPWSGPIANLAAAGRGAERQRRQFATSIGATNCCARSFFDFARTPRSR